MRIVTLRLAVGLLGERDVGNWWPSGFMSSTSSAFLKPVFGPNVLQARYHGVVESARRVHDEHIGIGRAFHPFRLPDVMEQRLFEAVEASPQELTDAVSSHESARATLMKLATRGAEARSGPALAGTIDALNEAKWVGSVASLYSAAFGAGLKCFPYFTGPG